ncbi:MAG: sigma-70 family RNA polymerase sigma factor [Kiritimatiellae bacterium]|nr:sigma-70 family RNA polymerase sigma factor [Kiritimatiellia bacterium]
MVPETSTTLLREISADAGNARWPEFVARYRPMMLAYLKTHFPDVDADDMVQETFAVLSKALPCYRYAPDETGRFRNYLTGILHKKALKWHEKEKRVSALKASLRENMVSAVQAASENEETAWRTSLLEIAMHQLLSDERIPDKSKQIFQRLTVDGIAPEEVATAYGTSRNNIDKTKSRMIARLRGIVRALEAVGDV